MNTKTNYIALICSILMIVSNFLPWIEVGGSASYMGYSSSYHTSVNGIDSGIGYLFVSIAVGCVIMVLINNRFMIVPGVLSLIISLLQLSGMLKNSVSIVMGNAEGHASNSIGIYLLIISSLLYVLSTIKNLNPLSQTSIASNPEPVANPNGDNTKSFSPKINLESFASRPIKINYKLIWTLVAIVIGFISYDHYDRVSTKEHNAIMDEQGRINSLINRSNEAVKTLDFVSAKLYANQIEWMYEPSDNSEYVNQYNKHKENLINSISEAQKSYEIAELAARAQQNYMEAYDAVDRQGTVKECDEIFSGTKNFCDANKQLKFQVTIMNDTIKILYYPDLDEVSYKDDPNAPFKYSGIILKNNIIATKNGNGDWEQVYSYVNGKWYQEKYDGQREYSLCGK